MTNPPHAFAQPRFPDDPSVPDVYADGMAVTGGPTSFALLFTLTKGNPPEPKTVAVVRLSPQQLAVMAKILPQVIANYEANVGPVALPDALIPKSQSGQGDA